MRSLKDQLEIFGVQEVIRRAEMEPLPPPQKRRTVRRIETLHEMLTELPGSEDLSFLHSGFCQTCLPHSRLTDDFACVAADRWPFQPDRDPRCYP